VELLGSAHGDVRRGHGLLRPGTIDAHGGRMLCDLPALGLGPLFSEERGNARRAFTQRTVSSSASSGLCAIARERWSTPAAFLCVRTCSTTGATTPWRGAKGVPSRKRTLTRLIGASKSFPAGGGEGGGPSML